MSQPPDNVVHFDMFMRTRQPRRSHEAADDTVPDRMSTTAPSISFDRSHFRVGAWAIVPLAGEMICQDEVVHLEPMVMDVLAALAERPFEVVSRAELLDRVWGQRSQVGDDCLTRAVSMLRKALDDSPRNPRYVQTLHKRGYRLIAPVELDVPIQPHSPRSY